MMPLGMSPFVRVLATIAVFSYRMRSNWLCVSSSGKFSTLFTPSSTPSNLFDINSRRLILSHSYSLFSMYQHTHTHIHLFSIYFSCAMFSFPFKIQTSILAFVLDPVFVRTICVRMSMKLRTHKMENIFLASAECFEIQNVYRCHCNNVCFSFHSVSRNEQKAYILYLTKNAK